MTPQLLDIIQQIICIAALILLITSNPWRVKKVPRKPCDDPRLGTLGLMKTPELGRVNPGVVAFLRAMDR